MLTVHRKMAKCAFPSLQELLLIQRVKIVFHRWVRRVWRCRSTELSFHSQSPWWPCQIRRQDAYQYHRILMIENAVWSSFPINSSWQSMVSGLCMLLLISFQDSIQLPFSTSLLFHLSTTSLSTRVLKPIVALNELPSCFVYRPAAKT